MKRATKLFTDFEKDRIQNAVTDAEALTSAEIVPIVATTSGRYDRAEDVAGLWFGLIAMVAAWFFLQAQGDSGADWGTVWSRFELPILVGCVVIGFVVGAIASNNISWLRGLFIPKRQMREEVEAAAARTFFDSRVHHTAGATGVLIYLSLFERTARILADQAVLDALDADALDALRDELIEGIIAGDTATAICEVIKHAGERLAEPLPREGDDENEHPDALVLLD